MISNFENVPDELKKVDCWVGWRKEERSGRTMKIPYNPINGKMADTTNPQTWGSFEVAISAYETYNLSGIGFVFHEDYPYAGIDIDHCVDENGGINSLATDIILQMDSYTEYSPSGSGVHILCKGKLPKGGRKRKAELGLEMYDANRYFTVTGAIVPESYLGVEERYEAFEIVHEKYMGGKGDANSKKLVQEQKNGTRNIEVQGIEGLSSKASRGNSGLTDEEIIEKAKRSKRGVLFAELLKGNWSSYSKSPSEAEISFLNMLAFWTGKDMLQMDRIYKMSGLYRAKWNDARSGSTHGQSQIEDAIYNCTCVYGSLRGKKESCGNEQNGFHGVQESGEENKEANKEISQASDELSKTLGINQKSPWYQILANGSLKFFAAILAKYLHERIPVVYVHGQAYRYENGVYTVAKQIELERIVKDHLRDDHATMHAIRDVHKQWLIECSRDTIKFDEPSSAHVINLQNGLFDTKKQKLLPHSPNFHSLIQLNCSYEPDARCEQFKEFINEVLPPESVVLAQEIVGYCLVIMTNAQKSFILYGQGGTGKSTFIRLVESLIGQQNVSNIAWQDLSDRFRPAALQGKLLNTFADIPDRAMKDVGMFKSLTGEDRVIVERKFQEPFSFQNSARFLFSTNHLPQNFGDNGNSFYRRLIILPFENTINRDKMDARLTEKLVREKDGIFLWGLEGLERLVKNDFMFSENKDTQKVLAKYQRESSSACWFIENNCTFDADYTVLSSEIFKKYQHSCLSDGMKPMDIIKFNHAVEENYGTKIVKKKDGSTRRATWHGVKLI